MAHVALLSSEKRELLQKWLAETGELYVDRYLPRSGGGGTAYFIRSIEQLEELVSRQTWSELVVTVFRRLQYPLRGIADAALLEQGLQMIPEGEWYTIVLLEDYFYPQEPSWTGSGNSHAEFRQEFSEIIGRRVGIGQDPFDKDDSWIYSTPTEVMVLYFKREGEYYEPECT